MVNDNQIIPNDKSLTHEVTTLFIKEDSEQNVAPKLYDLDLEFANTKKNKNRVIWISLLIFTLLFLAAAYFVTRYIEIQNSQIPIRIDAFEDVNLREIFDKAKQHEKEMQVAQRDLDDLYRFKSQKIVELNDKAESDIELIETQNPSDRRKKISNVKAELENRILLEEKRLDSEILVAKARILEIQEKIDSYDTRILEKAKEQESLINNQQQRFDMEMEKSVKYYEDKIDQIRIDHAQQIQTTSLTNKEIIKTIRANNKALVETLEDKYNPLFEDSFNYINEMEDSVLTYNRFIANNINPVLFQEQIIIEDNLNLFIENMFKGRDTFQKLKDIPYYNSPKQAINYLENIYFQSLDEYSKLINSLTPAIKSKNSLISSQSRELEQLKFFLTNYVKTNRINGVIIDPRKSNIKVFIDPIYKVKEGTIGYIFRNDSDFLGTIKFKYNKNILEAEINSLTDEKRFIRPFDMILINLN